jgi:hypothetical protein
MVTRYGAYRRKVKGTAFFGTKPRNYYFRDSKKANISSDYKGVSQPGIEPE